MAQQTALEWFFENIDNEILKSEYYYMYQRAKQMEKEQIKMAFDDGYKSGDYELINDDIE